MLAGKVDVHHTANSTSQTIETNEQAGFDHTSGIFVELVIYLQTVLRPYRCSVHPHVYARMTLTSLPRAVSHLSRHLQLPSSLPPSS